jgi:formylglycine-generating enzyme required for sulfatase activity
VLRGGSWNNNERGNLLSSNRNRNTPTNRSINHGFRCVLVVSGG